MPSIIYSMVYFNNRVVVDYTNDRFVGNFRDTACKLLAKILASKKGDKASYTMQKHTFNFKNINNVWFMCMADEAYGKQMPFVFLNGKCNVRQPWVCLLDSSPLKSVHMIILSTVQNWATLSSRAILIPMQPQISRPFQHKFPRRSLNSPLLMSKIRSIKHSKASMIFATSCLRTWSMPYTAPWLSRAWQTLHKR